MARTKHTRHALYIVGLVLLFGCVVGSAFRLDAISDDVHSPGGLIFVPSPTLMKVAALGFDNLLADIFWLRTIRYVYNQQQGSKNYDMLDEMLEVVTRLDPYESDIYERGGSWLYEDAGRPQEGIKFLEKGLKMVPEKDEARWRLAFHIGKCYREVLFDEKEATRYFELAKTMPGVPRMITVSVAAGYERQGEFEKAIKFWEEARDYLDSDNLPADFDMDQYHAAVSHEAMNVKHGLDLFKQRFGYRPKDLRGLISAGILSELPKNPVVFELRIMEIRATMKMMDILKDKVQTFEKEKGRMPKDLQELVEAKMINSIPRPAIRDAGGDAEFELSPTGEIRYVFKAEEQL
ncbi:MAG: hypothetical protein JW941_05025 [Candidatus Coatesbacteria bacterium]|nr:hypothetical protein [Candidatus Coatesbacteria bacterium]